MPLRSWGGPPTNWAIVAAGRMEAITTRGLDTVPASKATRLFEGVYGRELETTFEEADSTVDSDVTESSIHATEAAEGNGATGVILELVSSLACVGTVVAGALVLLGWMIDSPSLKRVLPGFASMKVNTAACFVLAGVGLALLRRTVRAERARGAGIAAALLVVTLGSLSLVEDAFGRSLGIDEIVVRDVETPADAAPGRMSPATAMSFLLSGCALLALGFENPRLSQLAAGAAGVLGLFALAGFLYGLQELYLVWGYSSMALHTAAGFVLLSTGTLVARPHDALMKVFTSAKPGGVMARRLWLPIVVVTLVVGGVLEWLEDHALIGSGIDSAFLAVFVILLSSLVIWLNASSLDRAHERLSSSNRLHVVLSRCRSAISRSLTSDDLFSDVCRVIADAGGFQMVWLGLIDPQNQVVSSAGLWGDGRSKLVPDGVPVVAVEGCIGTALREGRASLTLEGDTVAVPVSREGRTVGALVSFTTARSLESEDVRLLQVVAEDVAYALERVDAEVRRRRAETELAKLAAIVEFSNDAVVSKDLESRVESWNAGAERLFGYSAEEMSGKKITLLFRPGHLHEETEILEKIRRGERVEHFETGGVTKDGRLIDLSVTVSPIKDVDGRVVGASRVARDISAKKLTEEQLKERTEELARSNAELEQFAYVASHDLQEPLRAVAGCVQLLQNRYQSQFDERGQDLIRHTVEGATRMKTLIDDLLTLARVTTGRRRYTTVDSNELVQRALLNLEKAIEESGARVSFQNLPTVVGDATQLSQVLQNLIGNGVKFCRQASPDIHVSAAPSDTHWTFSVRDNGIGIESKYFDRIFAVFQRLHSRVEYSGTGIGLPLCKRIVEQHGGTIWVESVPGNGATFFFTLPMRAALEEPPGVPA
jgi:PAS domain S-box-containing protein